MIHARTACRHRTVPCVSVQRSFEMFFLVRAFYPERGKRLLTNVLLTRLPESEGAPIAGVYVLLTHLHASVLLTHLHVRYIRSRRERGGLWFQELLAGLSHALTHKYVLSSHTMPSVLFMTRDPLDSRVLPLMRVRVR